MKHASRDNCRHCEIHSESLDHLSGDCTAINYVLLREFFSKSSQIFSWIKKHKAWASKYDDALLVRIAEPFSIWSRPYSHC
jgi:hypothetical protein